MITIYCSKCRRCHIGKWETVHECPHCGEVNLLDTFDWHQTTLIDVLMWLLIQIVRLFYWLTGVSIRGA